MQSSRKEGKWESGQVKLFAYQQNNSIGLGEPEQTLHYV